MLMVSKERLEEKIAAFSHFGDNGRGGITRLSLSQPALEARRELIERCRKMGMDVKTDDLGNIYALRKGTEELPALIMGSHLDSVVDGGNYDGVLGVLTGLEVIETLHSSQTSTRHPAGVMVWTNEEGARFDPAMMCSGIVTGKFDKESMMNSADKNGIRFGDALAASGFVGSESNRLNPKDYAGYLELHIEQGPVLEIEGKEIGVVEGVVGMVNYEFTVLGVSDHAGTTPQKTRKDALYGASKLILRLWEELEQIDEALVFTMGRMNVLPNVHTVIPNEVKFTLDARHKDPEIIQKVVDVIEELPDHVASCEIRYDKLWGRDTVLFDEQFVKAIQGAANELNYSSRKIYSGAGHDAQYVAGYLPSGMIFVPSAQGHSHCSEEFTPIELVEKGTNVMLKTLLELDRQ
ncbi:MAG TPA: Zn-dependent hydrolase [Candidatus Pelethocola excrementipullorum]|nr:Zn-dependent hydrolase [Candidatus Pelethocola excrementipullorum]